MAIWVGMDMGCLVGLGFVFGGTFEGGGVLQGSCLEVRLYPGDKERGGEERVLV